MGSQKIMFKKSAGTLWGIVIALIIVMAMFYGMYNFIDENATEANKTISSVYQGTYTNLSAAEDRLQTTQNQIQSGVNNLTEADASFASAWNGLKGLIAVVKLPLNFIDISAAVTEGMIESSMGVLPSWSLNLIKLAIAMFILFVVWSIFKGDSNIVK